MSSPAREAVDQAARRLTEAQLHDLQARVVYGAKSPTFLLLPAWAKPRYVEACARAGEAWAVLYLIGQRAAREMFAYSRRRT